MGLMVTPGDERGACDGVTKSFLAMRGRSLPGICSMHAWSCEGGP